MTNAYSSTQVECFVAFLKSSGSTSAAGRGFVGAMDKGTRNLIDHLGAELAGTMEDASAVAALLRGVPRAELGKTVTTLERAAAKSQALVAAMRALMRKLGRPTREADLRR